MKDSHPPNSFKVSRAVLKFLPTLTAAEFKAYLFLCEQGQDRWVRIDAIVAGTEVTERSLRTVLPGLIEKKLIMSTAVAGKATEYSVRPLPEEPNASFDPGLTASSEHRPVPSPAPREAPTDQTTAGSQLEPPASKPTQAEAPPPSPQQSRAEPIEPSGISSVHQDPSIGAAPSDTSSSLGTSIPSSSQSEPTVPATTPELKLADSKTGTVSPVRASASPHAHPLKGLVGGESRQPETSTQPSRQPVPATPAVSASPKSISALRIGRELSADTKGLIRAIFRDLDLRETSDLQKYYPDEVDLRRRLENLKAKGGIGVDDFDFFLSALKTFG